MDEEYTRDDLDLENELLARIQSAPSLKRRAAWQKLLDIHHGVKAVIHDIDTLRIDLREIEKEVAILRTQGESDASTVSQPDPN